MSTLDFEDFNILSVQKSIAIGIILVLIYSLNHFVNPINFLLITRIYKKKKTRITKHPKRGSGEPTGK